MPLLETISRAAFETFVKDYLPNNGKRTGRVALGTFCTAYLDNNLCLERKTLSEYRATLRKTPLEQFNLKGPELKMKIRKRKLEYSIKVHDLPEIKDEIMLGFCYSVLAVSLLYMNSEKSRP
jgi:hypothetical protein